MPRHKGAYCEEWRYDIEMLTDCVLVLSAPGKIRLEEEGQTHSNSENGNRYLSSMRGLAGPNVAVIKPVKYIHGSKAGHKGRGGFERVARLQSQGIQHVKILS
jgi:hypothetical protein